MAGPRGTAGKGDEDRTFMLLIFAVFVLFIWRSGTDRVDPPVDTLEKALRLAGENENLTRFAWEHQPVAVFGLGSSELNRFHLVLMSRCTAPGPCNGTALRAEIDAWKMEVRAITEVRMPHPPGLNDTLPRPAEVQELPLSTLPGILRAAGANARYLDHLAEAVPPYAFVHQCADTCVLVTGSDCTQDACARLWRLELDPATGKVVSSEPVERSGAVIRTTVPGTDIDLAIPLQDQQGLLVGEKA